MGLNRSPATKSFTAQLQFFIMLRIRLSWLHWDCSKQDELIGQINSYPFTENNIAKIVNTMNDVKEIDNLERSLHYPIAWKAH